MIYAVAVFAPLFGALVSGLLGRSIGDRAAIAVSILCMLVAAALGPLACFQLVGGDADLGTVSLGTWVEAGRFHVTWALRYDTLSAVMVAMVTFVAMLIHVYSIGYMAHDAYPALSLLRLPVAVHLLHADAGDRGQPASAVLRLGRRRPLFVPADRLLVRSPRRQRRRDQGIHRQPHRRSGIRDRRRAGVPEVRLNRVRHDLPRRRTAPVGHLCGTRPHIPCLRGDRRAACSSVRWASRRRSACMSGCPTRWKARRRSPR